jgi:lysophospholipase L1-like esterase
MDILNRGFSGYNTDWALPITHQILPTVEDQKKQAATIPLMTIFFGANDAALDFSPQHVPLNRFRDNLNTMIQLVKNPESKYYNPKMRLMLITPPPINEAQWQKRCEEQGDKLNRTNESARAYANVVKEIGAEKQLVVIDIWSRLMDLTGPGKRDLAEFLFDGLHLNGNGYEVNNKKRKEQWMMAHFL